MSKTSADARKTSLDYVLRMAIYSVTIFNLTRPFKKTKTELCFSRLFKIAASMQKKERHLEPRFFKTPAHCVTKIQFWCYVKCM
jgi:hypothetical protein